MSDLQSTVLSFGPFRVFLQERRLEKDGAAVPLGSRAFEVLVALAEQAGRVVSKEDLAAYVWPNTVVGESGLRVQIATLRKALGDGQYITNIPGRGYCFVGEVARSGRPSRGVGAGTVAERAGHSLPQPLARMVGREDARQGISSELVDGRFVTVVGPGGMGKTTVAVAVAHELLAEFQGEVYFVDLAPLNDARQVATSVACAFGLSLQPDEAATSLIDFLSPRRVLLVLDSCERVMNEVAALSERLFVDTRNVHILATSREALRVEGERVHRMSPLDSPPEDERLTLAEALTFPAVQLFVERATAGGARLQLTDRDAPAIADICRRLDGIALAIELAAGRVGAYGVAGTAALLDNRLKLLWQGRRTAPPRHQTLTSMLDWSYDLLTESERVILRRSSIFVGRFSPDGVAAVAADVQVDLERALDILGGLVEKSLVSVDNGGPTARYRLLDTTRAYAQEKLDEANERDATARRHAGYICNALDKQHRDGGPYTNAEYTGNVGAALKWSFSDTGDTMLGAALAAASAPTVMDPSLLRECQRRVEIALRTLDDADRGTPREMQLQAALGVSLMFTRGNSPEVQVALRRSLALADELHDPLEQLRILTTLHLSLYQFGEFRESLSIAERSEAAAARLMDPTAHLLADWMIGVSHHLLGDQAETVKRCETALTPPPGSRLTMVQFRFDHRVRALIVLGRALWLVGKPEAARRVATQTIREAADTGQPLTIASAYFWTSTVFLWSGDLDKAEDVAERLIAYAARHSIAFYQHAVGPALKGELMVKRGAAAAGVEVLRRSVEALRGERQPFMRPSFATALAEGLGGVGEHDEALVTIDQALEATARNGRSFDLPEILRMKGHLLGTMPGSDEAEAERYLVRAHECAKAQRTLGWELRAATSVAHLWSSQGRRREARELLTSTYDQFTEGFQTSDLLAARQLLFELSEHGDPNVGAAGFGHRAPRA